MLFMKVDWVSCNRDEENGSTATSLILEITLKSQHVFVLMAYRDKICVSVDVGSTGSAVFESFSDNTNYEYKSI